MLAVIVSIFLGLLVAAVGAYKDIMWEPFSLRTFFRTPIICTCWGIVLEILFYNQHWFLIALSAIALERLTVELWKATIRRMPSKFKNKNRDTQWLRIHSRNR